MGLNCVQFDETNRPTVKEIIDSLKRQDDMNLHVINEEKLPADQVEQLARAPQESLNAGSPPRQNVPDENVPPRRNVPIEDVPPRQYVPAKEPPPHVYPASGFMCLFIPLVSLVF